jgi:hypothetical protein
MRFGRPISKRKKNNRNKPNLDHMKLGPHEVKSSRKQEGLQELAPPKTKTKRNGETDRKEKTRKANPEQYEEINQESTKLEEQFNV